MKITLQIDDKVIAQLKREAARQGRSTSELAEKALRTLLRSQKEADAPGPLPVFRGGGALVDVANRDALRRVLNEHEPTDNAHRILPPASPATGGLMPGIDLDDLAALQEMEDLDRVRRLK
ncbi:DUF6364 family protein [Vineibacter terrae]|uniref:DUF6364 family protein n=1 Tax=Vineibacter terrae TaxID=2586908 RepID=UPI002E30EFD9|nr:DUF6364 family protein [Vineibacter terrae]HEX2888436.1 DUF6364 family protein [Vineibacter terrae]